MTITEIRPLSGNRIALTLTGLLLAMTGVITLAGAVVTLVVDRQQDSGGFFTAGPGRLSTDTYAIAAPSLDFRTVGPGSVFGREVLGRMRVQLGQAKPLFVGIGPADDVAAYLAKIDHEEVGFGFGPLGVTYTERQGGAPPTLPAAQHFWVASGTGAQPLTWQITSGEWAAVIMNADGSAGVRADLRTGVTVPALSAAVTVTFVVGAVLLLMGTAMAVPRRRAEDATYGER